MHGRAAPGAEAQVRSPTPGALSPTARASREFGLQRALVAGGGGSGASAADTGLARAASVKGDAAGLGLEPVTAATAHGSGGLDSEGDAAAAREFSPG